MQIPFVCVYWLGVCVCWGVAWIHIYNVRTALVLFVPEYVHPS